MRRICCLCETWISGGIESFLCNVLTHMDLSDLEVDVVAARLGDSVFTETLRVRGIRFYELSGNQRNIVGNHRRLRTLIRERRYDVLHLNAYIGLSLAYLRIAKEEGVPVRIVHSHNTDLQKNAKRPIMLFVHRCGRERYTKDATVLWACSKDAASFLLSPKELNKRGFQFIPNGIDTERFRFDPCVREAERRRLGLEGKYVIGHVGRLSYQKNQNFLLDTFAECVKKHPESVLLMVGEGEDKPMLEQKAAALGIADKVLFYGVCEHIERLYCAMDVFAFPSLFEGLGIVGIEAQAAGLSVICSEHIPQEAYLTSQIHAVSLSNGASAWAEALMTAAERTADGADAVRNAGFEIDNVARRIEAGYLGNGIYGNIN